MSARKHILDFPSDVLSLPISELGRILASAMHDAESDDDDECMRHHFERLQFEDAIKEAVRSGQLQPRAPSTCLPMSMATPMSVVTVADLQQFLADIQCSVEIWRTDAAPELPPRAAAPPALVANSASNAPEAEPPPVATGDVAYAFDGLRQWDEKAWKDTLGSPPKWLDACITLRGQRGLRAHHWNPVLIGAALVRNGYAKPNSIRARFQTKPQLKDWLEAWKTYEADNFDTR